VAEHDLLPGAELAVPGADDAQVGAADARSPHAKQQLALADLGDRDILDAPPLVLRVSDRDHEDCLFLLGNASACDEPNVLASHNEYGILNHEYGRQKEPPSERSAACILHSVFRIPYSLFISLPADFSLFLRISRIREQLCRQSILI